MSYLRYLGLAAAIAATDQTLKWIILRSGRLNPRKSITLFRHFQIRFDVRNSGGAFGLLSGNNSLLIIVTGMAVIGLIVFLAFLPSRSTYLALGFALLLGGATGNFLDRMLHGAIIDYIQIWNFPVFNLADTAIVIGASLVVFHLFTE